MRLQDIGLGQELWLPAEPVPSTSWSLSVPIAIYGYPCLSPWMEGPKLFVAASSPWLCQMLAWPLASCLGSFPTRH